MKVSSSIIAAINLVSTYVALYYSRIGLFVVKPNLEDVDHFRVDEHSDDFEHFNFD